MTLPMDATPKSLRCLVLGGAGFIGAYIVDTLTERGHQVSLLDLRPNPWWTPPAPVNCIWGNWGDSDVLEPALQNCDVVIHLISTSLPATSNQNIVLDVQDNLETTLRLLDACVKAGVKKIVFASSGGTVYGIPQYTPITEDHPTRPLNSYGIVKLTIEHYLRLYYLLHGLAYVVLRGANPYGARQNPRHAQGAIGVFLGQIARQEPITIWGDGEVVRDYFHVADMAQAFALAAEAPLSEGVFNVGSGLGVSLVELLTHITTATGQAPDVRYAPARPIDVPVNILDIRRIQHQLQWQPQIDLVTGLRQTWDWMQTTL